MHRTPKEIRRKLDGKQRREMQRKPIGKLVIGDYQLETLEHVLLFMPR